MDLGEAVLVASSYNELDKLAKEFWEDLDDIIIKPRTEVDKGALRKTRISNVCCLVSRAHNFSNNSQNSIMIDSEGADLKIKPLFVELEDIIKTLSRYLP